MILDFEKEGLALYGAADISRMRDKICLPDGIKNKLTTAISIGYALSGPVLETLVDGPNRIYYFHYQRVNVLLDSAALKIAGTLQSAGYEALPIPASQVTDWKNMTGLLSHRDIAIAAGLAWHGRNNLAVNPRYGARVRYATILTEAPKNGDARLSVGQGSSFQLNGCGNCRACVEACPAGAIGDTPGDFKIELCNKKLKEFQRERGISQMICGMCVKSCTANKQK